MSINQDLKFQFSKRKIKYFELLQQKFNQLYPNNNLLPMLETLIDNAFENRSLQLKKRDKIKEQNPIPWFLSQTIVGMCLYVDRFNKDLNGVSDKIDYFKDLGVNFLHLMPLMESPNDESDGGYAVSNFRSVKPQFGSNEDLSKLINNLHNNNMFIMLDVVINHTSNQHEWAKKALQGESNFQDYYYFFDNYDEVLAYNQAMPDIFPENSPTSFTYIPKLNKHVMTVFHHYQWDLNYRNPQVFLEMLDIIFYYANLGVDILRLDAPAFIWKTKGSTCQNLPEAHQILQMFKLAVLIVSPGLALLAEAIVAPHFILPYFGQGEQECDIAYNATNMALQWDALATQHTKIKLFSQPELNQKPFGTTWINYIRCHDDIGLGYSDINIQKAGFNIFEHRQFIKQFYSGQLRYSYAKGALFGVNEKSQDARISGSLASLCGLEKALENNNQFEINLALKRINLLLAYCIFSNGIPMLYYGDEMGCLNDYSFLDNPSQKYDNRWMHRPIIQWNLDLNSPLKAIRDDIFNELKHLISIRKSIDIFADTNNIKWVELENNHVAGFIRESAETTIFCIFNYSNYPTTINSYQLKILLQCNTIFDLINNHEINFTENITSWHVVPYQFFILKLN